MLNYDLCRKDQLIKIISAASNRYGDKLVDFMERYNLPNLMSATAAQLAEYIKEEQL